MRFSRKFSLLKMNFFSRSSPSQIKFSSCNFRYRGWGMNIRIIRKVISWLRRWATSRKKSKDWPLWMRLLRWSTQSLKINWKRWICRVNRSLGSISRMWSIRWSCCLIEWMMFRSYALSWGMISFRPSRSWIELGFKEIKSLSNKWSSILNTSWGLPIGWITMTETPRKKILEILSIITFNNNRLIFSRVDLCFYCNKTIH